MGLAKATCTEEVSNQMESHDSNCTWGSRLALGCIHSSSSKQVLTGMVE